MARLRSVYAKICQKRWATSVSRRCRKSTFKPYRDEHDDDLLRRMLASVKAGKAPKAFMSTIWRRRYRNCVGACDDTIRPAAIARPRSRTKRSDGAYAGEVFIMTPSARLSAAIEVFADIAARRRPASDALKDSGLAHRFAGSSDRAAIAGLVYDSLRRRASSAWLMGDASPRAVLIGMLRRERGLDVAAIAALCDGARYAPAPLTEMEKAAVGRDGRDTAPAHIEGDYPDWLDPHLERVFGDERAAEGAALASRTPLDLRINTIAATREDALPKLAHLNAEATRWSPGRASHSACGRREEPGDPRRAAVSQGSNRVPGRRFATGRAVGRREASRAGHRPLRRRRRKTLALAAAIDNNGQIYATDTDKRRLVAITTTSRAPERATSKSVRPEERRTSSPILPAAPTSC